MKNKNLLANSQVKEVKLLINPKIYKQKQQKNNVFRIGLLFSASICILFTIIFISFIFAKGFGAFAGEDAISFSQFLFGNYYDGKTFFAAGFMVINTIWTSFLAIIIAVPISVLTALFITRIVKIKMLKSIFIGVVTILAAIPSVLYGAFGSQVIDTFFIDAWGLGAGTMITLVITLAFMIMPTITLMTVVSINAVDKKMENSALALGASKTQTTFTVTIRAAMGGIITGALLGIGRTIGEATAVSMIAAQSGYGPTFSLIENTRLLTSTMLTGFLEVGEGTIEQASIFAMAILLLLLIFGVFFVMRKINYKYDHKNIVIKQQNLQRKKLTIMNKVRDFGIESLSPFQKYRYKWYLFLETKKQKNVAKESLLWNKISFQNKKTNILVTEKFKKRRIFTLNFITLSAASIGLLLLIGIITFLFIEGTSALTWDFLTNPEKGIIIPLLNTIFMISLTLVFVVPLGILIGIYLAEYNEKNKIAKGLALCIDLLSGLPSLLFGLIGVLVFLPIVPENFVSLAGALTLTFVVLPTLVKSVENAILKVPKSSKEASYSLGSTKSHMLLKIALPSSFPQIISGVILSIGRIIAESAALVIVLGSLSYDNMADSIKYGGVTLATYIWQLTSMEIIPWDLVCATGIVILGLILILFLIANFVEQKKFKATLGVVFAFTLLLTSLGINSEWLFIFSTSFLIFGLVTYIIWENHIQISIYLNKFKNKYFIKNEE